MNISHKMLGNKLIIEIDISAKDVQGAKASSTGKTMIVGTSGRPTHVATIAGKPVSFSVNVMTSP